MNQYSTEPEFSVEELVKTPHMVKQLVSSARNYQEVEADLALLSVDLDSVFGILEKIRDSLLVLELSVQEQV